MQQRCDLYLESDTTTRPTYQAQSINHLITATRLDPSSSTAFYHLAYCQAEARSIVSAIESVRASLELDSRNIQSWHLLALLLTATREWADAAKAGDAGVSVWEQADEADRAEDEGPLGNPDENEPTVEARDFGASSHTPVESTYTSSEPLLQSSGEFSTARASASQTDSMPTSRVKRLQHVIQLRMTLNIIAEKMQGSEIAMLRHQDLFAFFSIRSGRHQGREYSRGMPGAQSVTTFVERGLGESFVSVDQPRRGQDLSDSVSTGEQGDPKTKRQADELWPSAFANTAGWRQCPSICAKAGSDGRRASYRFVAGHLGRFIRSGSR